jgi:hypothetical protein
VIGVLDARTALAVWDAGEREHPIDRALTVLRALAGIARASSAALPINRRDAMLLQCRIAAFGHIVGVVVTCPSCGCESESALDLGGMVFAPDSDRGTVGADERTVAFRVPNSSDLAAIARCADAQEAERALRARCIDAPEPVDHVMMAAAEREIERMCAPSSVVLDVRCPECDVAAKVPLDIGDFFWTEIATYARRALDEVDALAVRYGWTEDQILALTPARRTRYLEYAG